MPLPNRRRFVKTAALAAAALPLKNLISQTQPKPTQSAPLNIHIFSKHLQFLNYEDMAKAATDIGFDGVDLTVRPGGHVEPEDVANHLPRAHAAVHSAGLRTDMMTTAVDDASDPIDRTLLETAANLGIDRYRMNWFPYREDAPLPATISDCQKTVQALSELNQNLGLIGCYQNHAGTLVGASLWEVWSMLQGSQLEHMGIQYDIRHATVEGGRSWTNGLKLALPHIKTIVVKDFKWELRDGKTELVNMPVGEGMVDFKSYFRILKDNHINVPVSLHLEYDIGGAQWGNRDLTTSPENVYAAMAKDLETTRRLWAEA